MSTDRSHEPPRTSDRRPVTGEHDKAVERGTEESEAGDLGPHSPATAGPNTDPGPETGGYDDHSPSRHPTNSKGGYGAG